MGGSIGARLIRAGHNVVLVDTDAAHVSAIRENGLRITGPVDDFVELRALHEFDLLAVRSDYAAQRTLKAWVADSDGHQEGGHIVGNSRLEPAQFQRLVDFLQLSDRVAEQVLVADFAELRGAQ